MPGLVEALKHEKAAYWACLVLREIGPAAKDAVPALADTLRDSRPEIRREALLALAAMDDAALPALPQIAAALNDEHTRPAATYALGRMGQIPADAEAAVRANAKSDDKMLSTTSLWALARVHPEDKDLRREATERLIERLKDQDAFVRVAAARVWPHCLPLRKSPPRFGKKRLPTPMRRRPLTPWTPWRNWAAQAVPRLIDALKYEKIRGQVVSILERIGPAAAPATEALAKLSAGKDERVANEATLALANIGPAAKGAGRSSSNCSRTARPRTPVRWLLPWARSVPTPPRPNRCCRVC